MKKITDYLGEGIFNRGTERESAVRRNNGKRVFGALLKLGPSTTKIQPSLRRLGFKRKHIDWQPSKRKITKWRPVKTGLNENLLVNDDWHHLAVYDNEAGDKRYLVHRESGDIVGHMPISVRGGYSTGSFVPNRAFYEKHGISIKPSFFGDSMFSEMENVARHFASRERLAESTEPQLLRVSKKSQHEYHLYDGDDDKHVIEVHGDGDDPIHERNHFGYDAFWSPHIRSKHEIFHSSLNPESSLLDGESTTVKRGRTPSPPSPDYIKRLSSRYYHLKSRGFSPHYSTIVNGDKAFLIHTDSGDIVGSQVKATHPQSNPFIPNKAFFEKHKMDLPPAASKLWAAHRHVLSHTPEFDEYR